MRGRWGAVRIAWVEGGRGGRLAGRRIEREGEAQMRVDIEKRMIRMMGREDRGCIGAVVEGRGW